MRINILLVVKITMKSINKNMFLKKVRKDQDNRTIIFIIPSIMLIL